MALKKILVAAALVAASAVPVAPSVAAEKYPSRPIEVLVPWGPGGGADILGRKAAKLLEPILKVSMPVVNIPGATGQTGLNKMLNGPADGYTVAVMTGDTFGLLAGPNLKWGLKDIVPLGIMIRQSSGFLVKEGGKFKNWADVEKAAKGASEPLKVGVSGFGSPDDYTTKYFAKKGIKLASVPYAKPGERYSALLGGHLDLLYEQAGDMKGYIKNKQMRPVIFFAKKRDAYFPDVQVSGESGHEILLPQFRMLIVKAGTPAATIKVLSDALTKVSKSPEYTEYLKVEFANPESFIPHAGAVKFLEGELKDLKKYAK